MIRNGVLSFLVAVGVTPFFSLSTLGKEAALDIEDLVVVPFDGVTAQTEVVGPSPGQERTLRITFETSGDVRRMVALSGAVAPGGVDARVVTLEGELQLVEGTPPRVGVVLFGRNGERWIRKGPEVRPEGDQHAWTVSVRRMQPAAFTEVETGPVVWGDVERAWVGLIFDGPATGSWEVHGVRFTDASAPALAPMSLMAPQAEGWELHHDASIEATLGTLESGPDGGSILRVDAAFSGGKHLFCTCSLAVSAEQPEVYRSVRLTYRASLPPGIDGILFLLEEDGGACYMADPMPPASAQWRTLVLPYASFTLAPWTPDPNGKFDPQRLAKVWVGTHGVSTDTGGPGWIEVADVELLP